MKLWDDIILLDVWAKNWENAKRFFESKSNSETRAKLRAKWFKEFMLDMDNIVKSLKQRG